MSGDLATYGVSVREGAVMALADSADKGGPKLAVDWQDNAGDPKSAVSIFQKQMLASPDIYLSGVKPQTMAIKDQVNTKGMPHFVWIFDAFINQNTQNNFRTWVSYKIEPPVYLNYAKRIGARRVAIVYVQLPHTVEEFTQIVIPGLKTQGIAEMFVEPFEFGRRDFKDIGVKIAAFAPDLIILNGFQADLVGLVRALRPLNLIKDGNTIATYDMLDAANVLGADELEGIRLVAPRFETRKTESGIAEFRKNFRQRYGKEPLYTHAFAYDMIGAVRDAASRLSLPATSAQWITALRSTNIQGVTGPIRFDENGDLVTPLEVGVYRKGQLVPDDGK